MRRLLLLCLTLSTVPTLAGAPAPTPKPRARPHLAAPKDLPEVARQLLRRRMEHHAVDMPELFFAVTLLERDLAATIAGRIAAEPRFSRPIPSEQDLLNQTLPERFFVLQDELHARAIDVEQAAKKKDDAALAESFGRLTQTCVSCHSTYLDTPAPPKPAK